MDGSLSLVRRGCAEALAAFALVFAGCGAVVTDARYHGALGAVGISLVFGLIIMAMIYRHRASLGRPHQSGGHAGVYGHASLLASRRRRLHRRAGRRGDGGSAGAAGRVDRQARQPRRDGAVSRRRQRAGLRVPADGDADVRDHGRGHRHARSRRGRGHRHRRDRCPRCVVRRRSDGRVDEPGTLLRPCPWSRARGRTSGSIWSALVWGPPPGRWPTSSSAAHPSAP